MEEEIQSGVLPPSTRVRKDPAGTVFLEWETWEREGEPKSTDWYWLVGAVAFAAIVLLIFFKNFLFALIIGLAVFSLFMHERRGAQLVRIRLTNKGVVVGSNLYLYETIKSFWIDENFEPDHLILHSERSFFSNLEISLAGVSTPQVRAILSKYLEETREEGNFIENLSKLLGF